jgi:hypothetical protein
MGSLHWRVRSFRHEELTATCQYTVADTRVNGPRRGLCNLGLLQLEPGDQGLRKSEPYISGQHIASMKSRPMNSPPAAGGSVRTALP